jgi:hypothetical protein
MAENGRLASGLLRKSVQIPVDGSRYCQRWGNSTALGGSARYQLDVDSTRRWVVAQKSWNSCSVVKFCALFTGMIHVLKLALPAVLVHEITGLTGTHEGIK